MKTIECPKMVENTLHSEEKTIWQIFGLYNRNSCSPIYLANAVGKGSYRRKYRHNIGDTKKVQQNKT